MELSLMCPPKEALHGPGVGLPRIRIADFGGEELDHSVRRVLAGILKNSGERPSELGDQIGHDGKASAGKEALAGEILVVENGSYPGLRLHPTHRALRRPTTVQPATGVGSGDDFFYSPLSAIAASTRTFWAEGLTP